MPGRKSTPNLQGRTLAHYQVLTPLGKGGMGEVYAAEDLRLRRRVALKILHPELTTEPRHLERFRREARSIAALNHPNIVTIHSVEEAEGLHFLVLELVEGQTLSEMLAAGGPLPLARLLAIAIPLTEALEVAHAHGIIHRDLKPRNIMLSREGRAKILDFGIARLERPGEEEAGAGLTRTGGVVGTTPYMSPEQIQERPVDPRSDLFSLGIVLYEMATGQRPFRGNAQLTTIASILYDTPAPPSTLVPGLPGRFNQIVGQCLAKEPFLRYRGAAELRHDLLSLASGDDATTDTTLSEAVPPQSGEAESSSSSTRRRQTHPRLPARPRCFGREAEVRDLVETLRSVPPPPVPVLGPAGAGKTTISLAALHDPQVTELFGKRRWFVRCDGATGRDGLVGAIARVVCPEAAPPLEPKILFDLEEAPAVLVLDNFETPWERDTAAVEELLTELAALPGLALVVALRGEQRPYGLSWREAIHAGPLDLDAARSAFLSVAGERYRDDPDLDLLLLGLDGLALAVVLLASQAEGEPDLSMLRRIWQERRTALLQRSGGRERQQSLEVSLDLSIDSPRMTGDARRLLSILGLLPEGVAREDLEALLPGSGAEAAAVLRKVGLVFDQSSRLRMLAPVREYVRMRYPPLPEDSERTIDHYLDLARLGEKVGTEGGAEAVRRIRPELSNLETMILKGLEQSDPIPAIHSTLAYADAVRFIGAGGLTIIESARQAAKKASDVRLEAESIRKLGEIDLYRANYQEARERFEQAKEIYRRAGSIHGIAFCTARLAETYHYRAQLTTASHLYEEARNSFQELGDRSWEARCLLGLGSIAVLRTEKDGRFRLEQAGDLYRQLGDTLGEANCLQYMGQASFDWGDFERSRVENESALHLFRRVGSLLGEASCLRNLGHISLRDGNPQAAQSLSKKALVLSRRVGSLLSEANCVYILGEATRELFAYEQAESLLQQALQRFRQVGQATGVANCLESLGSNAASQADFSKARSWLEEALRIFVEVPHPLSIGRVYLKLARLFPSGSPERLQHIEAAREAWDRAGILDQMSHELEAVPAE